MNTFRQTSLFALLALSTVQFSASAASRDPGEGPAPSSAVAHALPPGALRLAAPSPAGRDPGLQAALIDHTPAASVLLNAALRKAPCDIDLLLSQAALAVRTRQPAEHETALHRARSCQPLDPAVRAALERQGSTAPTRARLIALLDEQPDVPAVHFALGNAYAGEHQWAAAERAYRMTVALDPDATDAWFNLGVAHEHLHRPALAVIAYRQALHTRRQRPAVFAESEARARLVQLEPLDAAD